MGAAFSQHNKAPCCMKAPHKGQQARLLHKSTLSHRIARGPCVMVWWSRAAAGPAAHRTPSRCSTVYLQAATDQTKCVAAQMPHLLFQLQLQLVTLQEGLDDVEIELLDSIRQREGAVVNSSVCSSSLEMGPGTCTATNSSRLPRSISRSMSYW